MDCSVALLPEMTTDGLRSPRQPGGNEFSLRSTNHKPSRLGGLRVKGGVMLRLKVLASSVPLIALAVVAGAQFFSTSHPCIAVDDTSVELSDLPWHADLHVAFTDDPAAATVRVGLADNPEAADFAVVDDITSADQSACAANPASRLVTVSAFPDRGEPVIYLAQDGPADFRIYVRSKNFSERAAAALVVGARSSHRPLQAASL
jgi:hypothetical protein